MKKSKETINDGSQASDPAKVKGQGCAQEGLGAEPRWLRSGIAWFLDQGGEHTGFSYFMITFLHLSVGGLYFTMKQYFEREKKLSLEKWLRV